MKHIFPTLDEVGMMACVAMAAVIALILMVGHAMWKSFVGEIAPHSRPAANRRC